jgi:hypothetical protein
VQTGLFLHEDGEAAMKLWIGAIALPALCMLGGKAIDPAAAANTAPQTIHSAQTTEVASQRRHHRASRHTRHYRSYYAYAERPYYLARPTTYTPAPFPLGFGFGFFWFEP